MPKPSHWIQNISAEYQEALERIESADHLESLEWIDQQNNLLQKTIRK